MKVLLAYVLLALALVATSVHPALAQDQKSESFVAKLDVSAEAVTFHPEGDYVGFVLQVAGPEEFYLQRSFAGDETPSLPLRVGKSVLADGSYRIQVTAQPVIPKKNMAALEKARAENDAHRMHKMMKEAGVGQRDMVYSLNVGVLDGKFVDPAEDATDSEKGDGDVMEKEGAQHGASEGLGALEPVRLTHPAPDATGQASGPALGDVAPPDVTSASMNEAMTTVDGDDDVPAFIAASNNPDAPWQKAFFRNPMPDGSTQLFEGYLRPAVSSVLGQLFQAYFREASEDGVGTGSWAAGYFQQSEDGFRFLDPDVVERAASTSQQPQLFDYVAQDDPLVEEPGAAPRRDILHNDDVIIFFSLCVGNDCVNGESFGFDTIRLKENNLRIDFLDTSSTASFPDNDWEITINDSSNGGAEYFAVTDASAGRQIMRLTAGAPANSLFVDSQGDVGLNNSTPPVELSIKDGDTPTVRLEQDGSSGFTPQTWDLAGNETNFFVRDVTNGSRLPFRIRPSANTSSIDIKAGTVEINGDGSNTDFRVRGDTEANVLFVDASVDGVGIGTDTPGVLLNVSDATPQFRFTNTSPNQIYSMIIAGSTWEFRDVTAANATRMSINSTGTVNVNGEFTAGTKTWKIDHPLDPENKYLSHVSIESPDMMNVYNGNVTLDAQGNAVVEMPDYFETLNKDFRYQLTAIGAPGPNLYVAREIAGNRFQIAGGTPGMKVSWQVTGIRQDPWAEAHRVQVEVDKPNDLRGYYQHPRVYGQPPERGIDHRKYEQAQELQLRARSKE